MQETKEIRVRSLVWEDPLEKEMATHSSILAWRIPWIEEPGGLQSEGSQRVGYDWSDWALALRPTKTSPFRMSGCGWVTTPWWISGSLRPFLCSSSVYSCHFLISSSIRSLPFLSFIMLVLAWKIGISNFLEEISCLSYYISSLRRPSYLSLLFSRTLLSVGCIFPFVSLFSAICKASSDWLSAFLHFFFTRMVLATASCSVTNLWS